ncbi:Radical SAM domain protein [Actinobacteria bacterium OK074]|nr:Radical SAM domain protein [Actinobacteria bacterium OK074]
MSTAVTPTVNSLELEVTGTCQATCEHCLASSGPSGTDGTMTAADWRRVIDQAADHGVKLVQFIGGEPTLYRDLPALVEHAVARALTVEIYSNLIHVRPAMWDVFSLPGIILGTSYYSDRADEHEQITKVRGSYRRTRANIATAVQRGIPLRAGIVRVLPGQRVEQAEAELRSLGVQRIGVDHARPFGRAAADTAPDPSQLCGRCTRGRAAVLPDGSVTGCVMSRAWPAGNVHQQPLDIILTGRGWADIVGMVPEPTGGACQPDDSGDCDPANTPACLPSYPAVPAPALEVTA